MFINNKFGIRLFQYDRMIWKKNLHHVEHPWKADICVFDFIKKLYEFWIELEVVWLPIHISFLALRIRSSIISASSISTASIRNISENISRLKVNNLLAIVMISLSLLARRKLLSCKHTMHLCFNDLSRENTKSHPHFLKLLARYLCSNCSLKVSVRGNGAFTESKHEFIPEDLHYLPLLTPRLTP